MREFKFFAEIPDKIEGVIYDEIDHLILDHYPDEIDIKYAKQLTVDIWPEATFLQVYELAEEIKLGVRK